MKISYKWILELAGVDWPVEELSRRMTNCGTAVEETEAVGRYLDKVVVGEVVAVKPIEGADKIRLATVDTGGEQMNLVCGAPNVARGQKVPVATLGAQLAGGIVIKKAKIRGVESCGMICSERELGLSDDHSGIMVLDNGVSPGTPVIEALDLDDYRLTFELTPNRPDSMSAIGLARDAAALAQRKVVRPEVRLAETGERASGHIAVRIEDPDACPRYAARVIRNVKIGPSPWWLKKRLLLSGIRPISNVVDVTNFVMLETGHPLHAFDLDRFGSSEVVVRRARDKEKFTTLDGEQHDLTPDVLLITNGKEGVAAGGVMGGLDSEVESGTTNILLEAAYFDPSTIRKSRKLLDLVTESSSRFEKGADPNGIEYAINRAAGLFAELCGGEVLSGIVDAYPNKITPRTVSLRPERCAGVVGVDIPVDRITQILTDLDFVVADGSPLSVTVPTFRPDVTREIDLIEEVVRMYGFENVPDATENIGPLFTARHREDRFRGELRSLLTGAGFDEVLSHGLGNSKLAAKIDTDIPRLNLIHPSSAELDIARNTLVSSVLTITSHNIAHRNLDLQLFEIGKVYFPPDEKGEWVETERFAVVVTGQTSNTWRDNPRPLDFYDVTGALEQVAAHFHLPAFEFEPAEIPFLAGPVSFRVKLDGKDIGVVGEVTPDLLKSLDIKQPVFLAELEIEPVMEGARDLVAYEPLPIYPAAPRDLALVVADDVKAGDLLNAVRATAGDLAEQVDIFDLYTGKQIEKGRKSIAIAIRYRSKEGSLSSEEVDAVQQKIMEKLKNDFNAEVRDK